MTGRRCTVRANAKSVVAANRKVILETYDTAYLREAGITPEEAFYEEFKYNLKAKVSGTDRLVYPEGKNQVARHLVDNTPVGETYNYDRAVYLISIGLDKYTDADKMTIRQLSEASEFYTRIMSRDMVDLYEEIDARINSEEVNE